MQRTFIQDPSVTAVFADSRVSDADLRNLEMAIMRGAGATVAGTGGIKKIRCGSAGKGKSGSVRVLFADYPQAARVYLLTAFGKNEKSNLSKTERNELQQIKKTLDKFFKVR